MIRQLRLSDLPRQLLPGRLGGGDLAYTRFRLAAPVHELRSLNLVHWLMRSSTEHHALASFNHARLTGVVLLQKRGGPKSWEVAHLFATPQGMDEMQALLERAVATVASRGGERLFLRVSYSGPLRDVAHRVGFFSTHGEEVFSLHRPMNTGARGPSVPLRPPLPTDAYGLFRLYNRTLPLAARAATGLTLDQWSDSREPAPSASREYVWAENDAIRAWLRLVQQGHSVTVDALLDTGHAEIAPDIVAAVGAIARGHRTAVWVVPSYQPTISLALQHRGWALQRTFSVLVRSVGMRVEEPALILAQA